MNIRKSGRTTGLTYGTIIDVNMTAYVNYGDFLAMFEDCILTTENMGAPGDSGSLVVDSDNKAIGLLFAGGESGYVICCKFPTVASMLNISFEAVIPTIHNLKLTKEGYYDHDEQFSIMEGETKNFDIALTPIEIPPGLTEDTTQGFTITVIGEGIGTITNILVQNQTSAIDYLWDLSTGEWNPSQPVATPGDSIYLNVESENTGIITDTIYTEFVSAEVTPTEPLIQTAIIAPGEISVANWSFTMPQGPVNITINAGHEE